MAIKKNIYASTWTLQNLRPVHRDKPWPNGSPVSQVLKAISPPPKKKKESGGL